MSELYMKAVQASGAYSFLGLTLHPVNADQVHGFIEKTIKAGHKALILNLNVHCVNLALKQPWLKNFLRDAQLVFCDGDGVRWGLSILGLQPPPKITYAQWMWPFGSFCEHKGYKLFFLGGKPGIAEEAAQVMKNKFRNLNIVGVHDGYFQKEGPENEAVINKINAVRPDILIVGFGMPIQERWLQAHWEGLNAHIFLTGGAVFDYVSGRLKRAPGWMISLNLEWLFRFFQEPKRLFVRYLIGNPAFFLAVLKEKFKRG